MLPFDCCNISIYSYFCSPFIGLQWKEEEDNSETSCEAKNINYKSIICQVERWRMPSLGPTIKSLKRNRSLCWCHQWTLVWPSRHAPQQPFDSRALTPQWTTLPIIFQSSHQLPCPCNLLRQPSYVHFFLFQLSLCLYISFAFKTNPKTKDHLTSLQSSKKIFQVSTYSFKPKF